MNLSLRLIVVALALMILAAQAAPVTATAGDGQGANALTGVAGKYEGNTDSPEGVLAFTCELKLEEGTLKGSMVAGPYSVEIDSATFEGDRLQMNGTVDGMAITIVGTWKAGVFDGRWYIEDSSGAMKMVKVTAGKK
ncbi:MAG: hypothetical protein ACE148_10190 [Vicinamibacterales bacterium]